MKSKQNKYQVTKHNSTCFILSIWAMKKSINKIYFKGGSKMHLIKQILKPLKPLDKLHDVYLKIFYSRNFLASLNDLPQKKAPLIYLVWFSNGISGG